MATIKLEDYEEFPVLPDNSIIHTKITDLQLKKVQSDRGDWEKLEFTFQITDIQVAGDGGPTERYESLIGSKIWGSVPFRFVNSPDNRLKQWVEAILGLEVGVGFELDTDLLVGRKVRAVTSSYAKKTTNPKTGQPFRAHQVDSLLPFGKESVAATATATKTDNVWGNDWKSQDDEPPF